LAYSGLSTVNVDSSSVTLSWTSTGDDGNSGVATNYDFRYATFPISDSNWSSATQVTNEPTPLTAGQTQSITISNLTSNTLYFIAAKIGDEVPNWSPLSNIITITTVPNDQIPPAPVSDLQANTGIIDGSISLNWTATGDDSLVGTASAYEIRYSTQTLTALNWASATLWLSPPTPSVSGAVDSVVLTGLNPGQFYWIGVQSFDEALNPSGISNISSAEAYVDLTLDIVDENLLPISYKLGQNYPNPFNPSTRISYSIPKTSSVNISIYNIKGELTKTLVNEQKAAGDYEVTWEGIDNDGHRVATGVYLYRIMTGDFIKSKKMVLVK